MLERIPKIRVFCKGKWDRSECSGYRGSSLSHLGEVTGWTLTDWVAARAKGERSDIGRKNVVGRESMKGGMWIYLE